MSKDEIKIVEEKEFLNKFLKTKVDQNWYAENSINEIIKNEAPDFLLKNNSYRLTF